MKRSKKEHRGIAKVFVENLKHYRNRAGFSQAEVAQRLNIAVTTVSGWELGKQPAFAYLDAIAKLFGIGVNDLFTPQNTPKEFTIETDSDFAECIWALVRSKYVMLAGLFEPTSKYGKPDVGIKFGLSVSESDECKDSFGLINALAVMFKMFELGEAGQITADAVDYAVRATMKSLRNE